MRRLESYALRRAGDIKHFQRDLHNISDWRLDPRKNAGVEDMVRDMATQEAAAKEAGEAAKGKAKDGLKEMLGGCGTAGRTFVVTFLFDIIFCTV